jgi:hypothetical protein
MGQVTFYFNCHRDGSCYVWFDLFVNHAGTLLVGIALEAIGMEVQIVTLRMVMARTKAMIGMVAHAGAVIGMEVEEDQHGLREEITGTGRLLMTARRGQGAQLPLTATKCSQLVFF